jgi:hypothetical protein
VEGARAWDATRARALDVAVRTPDEGADADADTATDAAEAEAEAAAAQDAETEAETDAAGSMAHNTAVAFPQGSSRADEVRRAALECGAVAVSAHTGAGMAHLLELLSSELVRVGPRGNCSPRHPPHSRPSALKLNNTL